MKIYRNPSRAGWAPVCVRPTINQNDLRSSVESVMDAVRSGRDEAVRHFTSKFDGVETESFRFKVPEIVALEGELKSAIDLAWSNIWKFHESQRTPVQQVETTAGVICWRKSIAIQKVGLYVPGGSAPLFSTLLMLGIPAVIAGCNELVVCTPPKKDGTIEPSILYVAQKLGLEYVFAVGGAQAIAAMTLGTESIPKVDKIFGPGNQYVTMAKQLALQFGVAIDMPAGPSEVLVIADSSSEPSFVAADLLSQAEHGPDSQVVLVYVEGDESNTVLDEILTELEQQLQMLPRKETAAKALENSSVVVLTTYEEAMDFSNEYAPEHLILATDNAEKLTENVINAGSVFIGKYSCESAGDYASGTNHTLPTNGYARNYSGVSLDSFQKKVTFQKLTEEGICNIGPAIEQMATAEQLDAHRNAVTVRLNMLKDA